MKPYSGQGATVQEALGGQQLGWHLFCATEGLHQGVHNRPPHEGYALMPKADNASSNSVPMTVQVCGTSAIPRRPKGDMTKTEYHKSAKLC